MTARIRPVEGEMSLLRAELQSYRDQVQIGRASCRERV